MGPTNPKETRTQNKEEEYSENEKELYWELDFDFLQKKKKAPKKTTQKKEIVSSNNKTREIVSEENMFVSVVDICGLLRTEVGPQTLHLKETEQVFSAPKTMDYSLAC